MKWSVAALGLAATAMAMPQAASDNLKPDGASPSGCSANYNGKFEVSVFKLGAAKRSIEKRDCSGDKALVLTLQNGILKDSHDRTGAIVANYQFQFDGPPQAGSIYTAGWSTCQNGSLALGSSTVFYQCLSGNFYNLYDRNWAAQCEPVAIVAMPCSGGQSSGGGQKAGGGSPMQSPVGTSMAVTTTVVALSDGQPQVTTITVPIPMCQIGDGQVQAHTTPCDQAPGAAVSQISDGQIQAPTNLPPVSQISDGQIQAPTGAPVSQISDGQVQAPTGGAPVSQISDGQVQAPTGGAPVSQISDGQVQAPTSGGAPVTQISDGQVQAPTGTGAPVTQISDGQVQAPTSTGAPVTQISDGQVQAPTGTGAAPVPTSTLPIANNGAKAAVPALLAAGMGAVLFL